MLTECGAPEFDAARMLFWIEFWIERWIDCLIDGVADGCDTRRLEARLRKDCDTGTEAIVDDGCWVKVEAKPVEELAGWILATLTEPELDATGLAEPEPEPDATIDPTELDAAILVDPDPDPDATAEEEPFDAGNEAETDPDTNDPCWLPWGRTDAEFDG